MGVCERCGSVAASGCQCSSDSSTTIERTGSGTASSPFIYNAIIDPASDNQLEATVDGLYVPTGEYVYAYAADDQNRADGEPIAFNANDPHTDPSGMHVPGDPTGKYDFNILTDGWYMGYAQALVRDTNPLTELNLYWEDDGGAGSRYSEGFRQSTPDLVDTTMFGWFIAGTILEVRLRYTGAGPADVQGGTRYRTYAFLGKWAKV